MKFEVIKKTEAPFDPEHSTFMDELFQTLEYEKNHSVNDFYIMSVIRVETWPKKQFQKRFIAREECPMPHFEQSVWHYKRNGDQLDLLWSLPPKDWCEAIRNDPLNCPEEIKDSLPYVMDYYAGALRDKAIELNREDKLRSDISLRMYNDDQMTNKEKHAKKMKEIHDQRKRPKLF